MSAQYPEQSGILSIESGKEGPKVLLLAGVHGDEYEPMVASRELAESLPKMLLKGSVTIVPNVNPSAYAKASRYGEDGLDLARICPGDPDGSASMKAAFQISLMIKSANYLVDMHTGGVMYDIAPLVGYVLHPDKLILEQQREMALAFNLPVVWGTDFKPEGRTLSVARDAGVPAIYLEFGGGTGFRSSVVEAYKSGFVNLLRHLKMIAGEPETEEMDERYWVEDHREDSGFLQGKMPSPAAGVFIASVKVGDQVRKGQQWGRVVNLISGTETVVLADCDGLAFLLRNLVKVETGDALGGILQIVKKGKIEL